MSAVHPAPPPHGPAGGPGYEKHDLPVKTITIALVVVGVLIVLGFVVSLGVFNLLSGRGAPGAPPAPPQATRNETDLRREPLLLVDAPKGLAGMRAEENKILTTYGWTDQEAGRVRIPIDRAIALLLERGLPAPAPPAKEPAKAPRKRRSPKTRGTRGQG
jgi:hypothetical protein